MGGVGHAAEGAGQRRRIVNPDGGGPRQEGGFLPQDVFFLIHIDLGAEYSGVVGNGGEFFPYQLPEFVCLGDAGEQAHHMGLLRGGQLHPRQGQQAVVLRRPAEGGAVAGGVVVGEGNHIDPSQGAHSRQVGGGVVLPAAGRQAGVKMEVKGKTYHETGPRNCGKVATVAQARKAGPRRRRVQAPPSGGLAGGRIHSARGFKNMGPPPNACIRWGDRQE